VRRWPKRVLDLAQRRVVLALLERLPDARGTPSSTRSPTGARARRASPARPRLALVARDFEKEEIPDVTT
jgi:hypothetical protein